MPERISARVAGTPPTSGSPFCSSTGREALAPTSMPDVTTTAPDRAASWAQAWLRSTEKSVMHGSSRIGRPFTPPSSALTNATAACAAARSSGNEPAGEFSWLIIVIRIGSAESSAAVARSGMVPANQSCPANIDTTDPSDGAVVASVPLAVSSGASSAVSSAVSSGVVPPVSSASAVPVGAAVVSAVSEPVAVGASSLLSVHAPSRAAPTIANAAVRFMIPLVRFHQVRSPDRCPHVRRSVARDRRPAGLRREVSVFAEHAVWRVGGDHDLVVAVLDRHPGTVHHRESASVGVEVDPQLGSVSLDVERDALPRSGQPRRELEVVALFGEAREPVDDAGPHATRRGHVHAVGGVEVGVAQVEVERTLEVLEGQIVVADLGGDHRLHARRQRRVTRGDRVVVVEVAPLLLHREALGP